MINKRTITSYLLIFTLIFSLFPPTDAQAESGTTVHRDEYGVPHIYADSIDEMYKTYGYVMAKDRLFQLEMFKRANEGRGAEVYGEEYLEHDEQSRRDGYSDEEIQEMIDDMDDFSQDVIHNFAEGIDTYVQETNENPDKLSEEFNEYEVEPESWEPVDILRLFMASMTVFMDQEQELENAEILESLTEKHGEEQAQKMFNDIFWINDPASPTTSDSDASLEKGTPFGQINTDNTSAIKDIKGMKEEVKEHKVAFDEQHEALGIPLNIGSNAAVIGSSKSESGDPIMFGGPQVGFSAPGFIYEVGLHGPDFNAQGSSFLGYPFLMFGSTDNFSFGETAGFGDVVDIFEEQLNPDNSNEYKHNGEWKELEKRTESINVKQDDGSIESVSKDIYHSVHGPVIAKDEDQDIAYTKQWAFRGKEAQSWEALLAKNWSKDLDDFAEAAQSFAMSLNWFYADAEDNIGYFATGQYPVRSEEIDGRLPTPGTGEYDWNGYHDPKDNPQEINPDRGYFANWNNKPAPNWNNNEQTFNWGADNRVHMFMDGIEELDKLTVNDVNQVNYDASFADLRAKWFKPFLLDVIADKEDPLYTEAYDLLENWNGLNEDTNDDGYYDSTAGMIMKAWWDEFVHDLVEEDLGEHLPDVIEFIDDNYGSSMVLRMIQGDEAELEVEHNWIGNQSIEDIGMKSFKKAMNELKEEHGESIDDWQQPIETMVFGPESLIGIPYGSGDEEPIIEMNRGSQNHFVEMTSEGPIGKNVTPPGQAGFISKGEDESDHYRDQISLFANFEYKPMLFKKEDVEEATIETNQISFEESNNSKSDSEKDEKTDTAMSTLSWIILIGFLIVILVIGLVLFIRKGRKNN